MSFAVGERDEGWIKRKIYQVPEGGKNTAGELQLHP